MSGEQRAIVGWERHVQTAIMTVALGLLGWNFTQVQGMSLHIARQTEQIASLKEQITFAVSGRYRSTDAARDFAERDRRIDRHDTTLTVLYDRLRQLEGKVSAAHGNGNER